MELARKRVQHLIEAVDQRPDIRRVDRRRLGPRVVHQLRLPHLREDGELNERHLPRELEGVDIQERYVRCAE